MQIRTSVLIDLSLVEIVDDLRDRLDRPVPLYSVRPAMRIVVTYSSTRYVHLEVTSNEESATHVGG